MEKNFKQKNVNLFKLSNLFRPSIMISRQLMGLVPKPSITVRRFFSTSSIILQKSATPGSSTSIPHPHVTSADYKPPVTIDRELPDPFSKRKTNRRYLLIYGIGITLSCIAIFNYEKTQSPIITSSLYFLRRSQPSIELLGKDIDYSSSWPWIWGKLNTVQGIINIEFSVKGSKGNGVVKLNATRESKAHPFDVHQFVLEVERDGKKQVVDLTKEPNFDFM
ncbi:hypothetical protein MEW_03568 [Candida albicans P60002]|nr:hypothetical protein MG7_03635 [Candida albicans P34048]KGU29396.1 hypothetical protein MGK_03653 [Candida albicans P57055]KHC34533.1 hypothetical protein MGQ_03627 [Candida albicans P76067]KHC50938.1 hypothetical protein MEW_03568 [Candida albicans P60002]KHC60749.1 hypothetical protein MGE_03631 [Candida albicans P75010]KHC76170.1 hypothetical protein MGS_03660 [Candida albicans P78042]